jgi:DNA-binding HxlR family transcriptional regulator
VDRADTGQVPAPVIYSLSAYGRSVMPIAETVRQWGHGHIAKFSG